MGKRNKNSGNEKMSAAKRKKEKKKKLLTAVTITTVIILSAVILTVFLSLKKSYDNGEDLRKLDVVTSENYKVNGTMMSYYISGIYNSIVDYYEDYLSAIGLDIQKKLKDQAFNDSKTWFEFISDSAVTQLKEYLVLAEAARADGISLLGYEETALSERAHMMNNLDMKYGRGVTEADISDSLKLSAIAAKYKKELAKNHVLSDEEIEELYVQNRFEYESCDFIKYELNYDTEYIPDYQTAKKYVDTLLASTDENEFTSAITNILKNVMGISSANAEATVSGLKNEDFRYDESEPASEWLFGERKQYDTCMIDDRDNNKFYIYMVTDTPEKDTTKCVSIRNILIGSKENADAILAQWQEGDRTEEEFAYLALAYSTDSASAFDGGLYEFVKRGQLLDACDEWCFDEKRNSGDCDTIETDYGWYIIYWIGENENTWRSNIIEAEQERYVAEKTAEFVKKYPVSVNETFINKLDF